MNLETRAGERWAQRVQPALKTLHVSNAQGAEIENHAGAVWDDIGARAALDEPRVDGHAATQVIPFLNARDLPREFVDCVDAFLWCETSVRGPPVYNDLGFADPFPRGLQQSTRSKRGFQHEYRVTAARFGLNQFAGRLAADLFVGSPEKDDPLGRGLLRALQRLQREQCLHDARLHIESSRAVCLAASQT